MNFSNGFFNASSGWMRRNRQRLTRTKRRSPISSRILLLILKREGFSKLSDFFVQSSLTPLRYSANRIPAGSLLRQMIGRRKGRRSSGIFLRKMDFHPFLTAYSSSAGEKRLFLSLVFRSSSEASTSLLRLLRSCHFMLFNTTDLKIKNF